MRAAVTLSRSNLKDCSSNHTADFRNTSSSLPKILSEKKKTKSFKRVLQLSYYEIIPGLEL